MKGKILIINALLISSCGSGMDDSRQAAIIAAESSIEYAKKDGVDFGSYALNSVVRLGYGDQSVVHKSMNSPYIEAVKGKLRKKRYWEACYGVSSDFEVGATYCYYLDEKDFRLIASYKIK